MSDEREPLKSITTPVRIQYQYTPGQASQRFLKALAQGKLMGQRCPSCQKVIVPARGACARCGVATSEEVEVAHKGTVVTYCIVRVPSDNIDLELPYTAAHVLLDGADIAFQALIQECQWDEVRAGMRVEAVWRPEAEWSTTFENIKHFRPIDEPDVPYEEFKEYA